MTDPQTPYEILGDDGIKQLAGAFCDVMNKLPEARTIRAMHAENLDHMKRMLGAYLVGWMGGPPVYLALKGTVCLTDPHAPFRIGKQERDQWLLCMDSALDQIDASQELKEMLKQPLFQIADTVRNCANSDPGKRDPNIIAVG